MQSKIIDAGKHTHNSLAVLFALRFHKALQKQGKFP
jgi:hypothetical protein